MERSLKIILTKEQRTTVKRPSLPVRARCTVCKRDVETVTSDQAAELLEIDSLDLHLLITNRAIHEIETVSGSRLVCKESLFWKEVVPPVRKSRDKWWKEDITMKSSEIVWMFFVIGILALAAPSQGEAQTCWRLVGVDTIADHRLPNDPWYNQGVSSPNWIGTHDVWPSGDQYRSQMRKWTGLDQSSWLVNIREARGEYNQADGSKASVIWGVPPQLWCSGQQFMLSAQLGAQRTGRSDGFVFYSPLWVGDDGRLHPAAPFRQLGPPVGRHPLANNSGSRIEIDTLYYNEQSTRGSITVAPVADPKLKEWGLTFFMGMNSNDEFAVHYHYRLAQAGPNPPVPQPSPNPPPRGCGLGVRWNETESGFNGNWTKRWGTNVFDAAWGGIRAVLTMSLQGNTVSIARRQSTDGVNCDYTGTIAADGVTVTGTYRCPPQSPNPMPWRATIICNVSSGH